MIKDTDNSTPRTIPRPIRRLVRQQCGYGCVICGCPIYNYDHIEEFSVVHEHTAENLVLLCPTCHLKKGKLISKEMIINAKKSPRLKRTTADWLARINYSVDIGGNLIQNFTSGCLFQIWDFGHIDISFNDGPLIYGVFTDGEGTNAIEIFENEYILSSHIWDIEYVGKKITFRKGSHSIFLTIEIDVDEAKISIRGNIKLSNGVRIEIKDDGIFADSTLLVSNNIIANTKAGLTISGVEIPLPATITGGHVYRNTYVGVPGIFCLNTFSCTGNVIQSCDMALVWTTEFLAGFAEQVKRRRIAAKRPLAER